MCSSLSVLAVRHRAWPTRDGAHSSRALRGIRGIQKTNTLQSNPSFQWTCLFFSCCGSSIAGGLLREQRMKGVVTSPRLSSLLLARSLRQEQFDRQVASWLQVTNIRAGNASISLIHSFTRQYSQHQHQHQHQHQQPSNQFPPDSRRARIIACSLISTREPEIPFTDASSRLNVKSSAYGDYSLKSDPMSLVTSQISPRSNVDSTYLPFTPGPQTPFKRVSAVSRRGKRKTHVGPWHLGRTLGEGATGRVRLAKHAITGQEAAIKIVSKKSARMVQSESIAAMDRRAGPFAGGTARPMPCGIEREVVIMKLIEHPNVISLYDIWENRGELYLVLEYVEGGDLFTHVDRHGPLPEEEAVRLFRQIIAGLGFCHRFNICHRDLKPENILLDSWQNVKLADFGMAALQPTGHWLKTSCGSPHYAAPEVTNGRYRGDLADIWSCGIVLYVLLTGQVPFDGRGVPGIMKSVHMGKYTIPHEVSYEAADLIQQILQQRPENRITVQEMFRHPLLQKYEKLHQAMSKHYVGPPPPLSVHECGETVASAQEIDMDILRNLQTLWHRVKPEALVQRILCLEPTQERMFYNALVRFRDEQLENYQGQPLEYSASDYHHISRRPMWARSKRSMSVRGQHGSLRRQQFSVKKPQGHRGAGSIKEPMSSASYDPFRSPRNVRIPEAEYANITVHRESSAATIRTAAEDIERPANPVPGDDMDEDSECPPSSPFAIVRNKKGKGNSMRTSHSRTSQTSSRGGTAHAHTPRSASYRRNVSFHHIRHRSQGSASGKAKQVTPRKRLSHSSLDMPQDALSDRHDSPGLPAQPTVVRSTGVAVRNCPQVKKVRDSDFIWKDETRQISQELSKICEEAFNGSSMSTGCTTSVYGDTETPPTSVSIASPENSQHQITVNKIQSRGLPDTPGTSPFRSGADLAETRRRLIEHSRQEGSDVLPTYLSGVINQLDRLIEEDAVAKPATMQENLDEPVPWLNDPFMASFAEPGHLPIISEEMNGPLATSYSAEKPIAAIATDNQGNSGKLENKTTIRMVPHDSMRSLAEVKPLNIRKKGKEPAANDSELSGDDADRSIRYASAPPQSNRNVSGLDPIEEHPGPPMGGNAKPAENKKWSWFRHRSHESKEHMSKSGKDRPIQPSGETVIVHDVKPEERPSTSRKSSAESIGSLFKKLIKRKPSKTALNEEPVTKTEQPSKPTVTITENPPPSSIRTNTKTTTNKQKPLPRRPRAATPNSNTNWFARVFQIKPATRVMALNTSELHARKQVFRILREWKHYGLKNISLDKSTSVIHARVATANFLRLRPVEFSAEFYTVVEHGRQGNQSLVRFRQEKGAASSFGKVVDSLNLVMRQRELLVGDPARAEEMARILDYYPN